MNELITKLKKNKIKILKLIITIAAIYYLIVSFMNLLFEFNKNLTISLIVFYLIIIVIFALVSEFSPYILHNHLVQIFPFLTNYSGRAAIYLLAGSVYCTPEVGHYSNLAGYFFIVVGGLCLVIHFILASNIDVEHQDLMILKNNYEDFGQSSYRESFNFPNKFKDDSNTLFHRDGGISKSNR